MAASSVESSGALTVRCQDGLPSPFSCNVVDRFSTQDNVTEFTSSESILKGGDVAPLSSPYLYAYTFFLWVAVCQKGSTLCKFNGGCWKGECPAAEEEEELTGRRVKRATNGLSTRALCCSCKEVFIFLMEQ